MDDVHAGLDVVIFVKINKCGECSVIAGAIGTVIGCFMCSDIAAGRRVLGVWGWKKRSARWKKRGARGSKSGESVRRFGGLGGEKGCHHGGGGHSSGLLEDGRVRWTETHFRRVDVMTVLLASFDLHEDWCRHVPG